MTYKKTEPKANFSEIEHSVLQFWREDDTFHKSLNKTKMGEPFNFYDGPPFGNGLPHLGHLGVSAIKDMVSRYQTMRGKHVVRELGWDCHGLPAENSVEKKQGRTAKTIVEQDGNNYVITNDNFKKMVLLIYRIKANIPVIIMGDTGCGKTALIIKLNQILNNGQTIFNKIKL